MDSGHFRCADDVFVCHIADTQWEGVPTLHIGIYYSRDWTGIEVPTPLASLLLA